ncbi:rRNA biogenesis protein RRP5 isoform X3 [Punica granatum]|uniref:Protein RRP5 homolog n=1 Tax=Punica granatum TaxID=22663 RepID=A0A6P8DGA0_PUNGR|nr:rRNA biogenesis protein RRP5 isoform X3 [Punica granatum]
MAAPKSQKKKARDGPKVSKASKQPFKPRNKSLEAAQPQALPFQLQDDMPDFPRGGGSFLSRKEREEVHAEVDRELEAEENASKSNKKKNMRKKVNATEDDLGSLFGDGISGKLPRFANRITLKNICPGMKLWGVISEVNEKDLVVNLPGGLRGLVRAADALDPALDDNVEGTENVLSSLFSVGQLVSSVVSQVDDDKKEKGKRKIWLSLRLSSLHKGFTLEAIQEGMVLSACVKSIEDHGYILHFGSPSFTGFLPKPSQGTDPGGSEFKSGKLLQGVVKSIDKTRKVVYLNSDLDMVSKIVTKDLKGISMDLLVPGMMVNARVQSTLENGIMLSFLTYFTGTVDLFHLLNPLPTKDWKDDYPQNKKVNARILFIDPLSRAVGLTLNPHLVHNKAPPLHVGIGDIYENSKVVRIDRGRGLLLEVPSSPVSTSAYVSVLDIAEDEARKLEKKFKEGSKVRVRILGFKHLEGLAVGVLKAAAFEGSVFTHSDVKPGMVVRAKIIAVDDFGAIVQFPGGVKALCPVTHMSEFEIAKPRKKFQVGAELVFRVLGCKSKRITVTHKKTLLKSKLPILSSYADATDGLLTHGWIAKIEKHGCFVRFYNGVQGFAPRHDLGLEPGSDPTSMYHVGQAVKCRVTSSVPSARRINLSFTTKHSRVSEEEEVKVGSIVSGVVDGLTPRGVIVYVNGKGYSKGIILEQHLADHHELATLLKCVLKPGAEFDQLLVLDIEGHNLVLSAKHSLINSAEKLPSEISEIHPNIVVHGFVCNLIETGCFVRFLGRLTGFSPRKKATDDLRADLSEAFFVGQSVRSEILDVDNETGRITVSLKQSTCSSTDSSLIEGYFQSEEKIAKLQLSDSNGSELEWGEGFKIGSIIEGRIQEAKDFGVVVSFDKYNDVFGFITHYQSGSSMEVGSTVRAVVLDVSKREHLVDLSIKPELVKQFDKENSSSQSQKQKRKREASKSLEVHQTVTAVVEIVKENYLVLSVPEYNSAIGFAMIYDYNTQKFPKKQFSSGQSVGATVMALPSPSTTGRLLLVLKSVTEASETSSSKRARKKLAFNVGSLVQAEITEIKPLELQVKFGVNLRGRIHITEITDGSTMDNPFGDFKVGQTLTARIIAKTDKKRTSQWELSIKQKMLTESSWSEEKLNEEDFSYSSGQPVSGYVYKVDRDWIWMTISRQVNAQLFILDSSCEPNELQEFQRRFPIGKAVSGYVLSANREKKLVRLVPRSFPVPSGETSNADVTLHMCEGDVVGGRISKILPGVRGVVVQLGPTVSGRVHFSELTDSFVTDPLSGYHEGQFVKCKVIETGHSATGTLHIDLSFRSSLKGMGGLSSKELSDNVDSSYKRVEKIEDLHPNMMVQGYVKNVSPKGCFILLSRKFDAKILLSNLASGFVDDPDKEFPVGKLVMGRVLSVEPVSCRVEVTLKTNDADSEPKPKSYDFSSLHIGAIVSGRIKRMEAYGLFITIDHTNLVGLCHISELSDDHVDNIESKYKAGEKVTAKILKVDEERRRISLGMKNSYFQDVTDIQMSSDEESDGVTKENSSDDEINSTVFRICSSQVIEEENGGSAALAQVESRASVPPLEVPLEEIENPDEDNHMKPNEDRSDEVNNQDDDKSKKRAKKKAKEERERQIRAAEERLLEKDIPRTADEFEKLVRSSPNSSFVWIKYMAFMLSLADVEKAREIAERALRTINIREESEKLNVWVAYFNLESEYGNPREEAVQNVFQRSLQYCDPKKVHLALLGMYERTEQYNLADDLLGKMVKKFKHSCKVWLRRVHITLKQEKEDVKPVITRALICLPHHKHIKFITQTAILEFKCGVPDRGRSLFEKILREYPKRTDLWSVYIDQEIRLGDTDVIRALFERATSLSLPLKKIKFLFKKYLMFEKNTGDEERVEYVKRKAMEYAENTQD